MATGKCHICELPTIASEMTEWGHFHNCRRCGEYSISHSAQGIWARSNPTHAQIANAGGWIRDHPRIRIDSKEVQSLLSQRPLSVAERAARILVEIYNRDPLLGTQFCIPTIAGDSGEWLGISWSYGKFELEFLISNYLISEKKFLWGSQNPMGFPDLTITPAGYEFLEQRNAPVTNSQIGFCAMWFDESLNPVWANTIEPAILAAGYEPKRIDKHEHNNKIDDEIVAMLRRSKFVVADFTGQRGGVYFEAGFALGQGLPVFWACRRDWLKKLHFDTRQYNFIVWEEGRLSEFGIALQNRIEALLGRGSFIQ